MQVLGNLVENSLCYSDTPGRILIRMRPGSQGIALVIEDSAPGVTEADLPRLFEPLFRVDAARSRQRGGSATPAGQDCMELNTGTVQTVDETAKPIGRGDCLHERHSLVINTFSELQFTGRTDITRMSH